MIMQPQMNWMLNMAPLNLDAGVSRPLLMSIPGSSWQVQCYTLQQSTIYVLVVFELHWAEFLTENTSQLLADI